MATKPVVARLDLSIAPRAGCARLALSVSLLPAWMGEAKFYWIGALLLDAGFLYYAAPFVLLRSNSAARRLLAASIIYLPALFVVMVLARG